MAGFVFRSPPGWPDPPAGWTPPDGWIPDPSWPPAPPGWEFWAPAPPSRSLLPPSPAAETTHAVTTSATEPTIAAAEHRETQLVESEAAEPAEEQPATPSIDADRVHQSLKDQLAVAEATISALREAAKASDDDLVDLDDERVLQEVGIYHYHHPLETATDYRDRLTSLQDQIKELVKHDTAILASDMFTFNNSLARGRKMTSDFSKLMLRAYNAEADSCVRSLRAGNVVTAKKRLDKSVTTIAKLGSMMEMQVNPDYHLLRTEELELTADFLMKQQEEREAAREERERLREQRKVEQELAAERERLTKEQTHYANALAALTASGDEAGIADLAAKLAAIDDAIAHNDYRAANIRAGYVYVISNIGAFGPNVIKIGMTRRLEPMDRVRELGDASVPFPFDVHAMYFSDDAVTLENELHKIFANRRLNRVNERREYFFATPQEVRTALISNVGNLLEYTEQPEAAQYRQSKGYWPPT